jgi:hypothetical protein
MMEHGADVDAKEKVRRRNSVSRGEGADEQRMFGTALLELGATECN